MGNVPPEYEDVIKQAEAELRKQSKQKTPSEVLVAIYDELVRQFIDAQKPPEGFNPNHIYYLAEQTCRVIERIQGFAEAYPPTHRKGMGKDGGIITLPQDPWIFYFEGGGGGGGTGDGGDGTSSTEPLDWAPSGEIDRAKKTLHDVADEMGFGPKQDPLPLIKAVAKRLGGRWGLNGKRGNANDISKDVLAWDIPGHKPQLFDVIGDSGGNNQLTWQPLRYGQASVWVAP